MSFRVGGGWRNCNHRRRLPGFVLSLELLENRLVPALDLSLSSLTFAEGLVGGEEIGTFSVTGATTAQKFTYALVQGIGDADNARFQVHGDRLAIDPGFSFSSGTTYSILVQATGALGEQAQKTIHLTAKPDLVVDTILDSVNPADGKLSLREALAIANANPDHDRIVFAKALASPVLPLSTAEATLEGPGAFLVSTAVSLDGGDGHAMITRSATAPSMRLFTVTPSGNLRLERIDLKGGVATGVTGSADARGGAVLAHGPFSLFYGSIVGSSATGLDGPVPGNAAGGAIYADSDLHLFQSTLSGNIAKGGTGTSTAGVPVSGSGSGGAVFLTKTTGGASFVQFESVTVAANSAASGAGVAIKPPGSAIGATINASFRDTVLADNPAGNDLEQLAGPLNTVLITLNNSYAEALPGSLATLGFVVGETLLGPLDASLGSPVHRPLPGSPLIGTATAMASFTDQTGLRRNYPSAVGAAEFFAAPEDITLDTGAFPASLPDGAEVGSLSASGQNAGIKFTFMLAPASADNAYFQIVGNRLGAAPGAVFTPASTYTVRVRATGATGLSFEKDIPVLAKADIVVDTAADVVDATDGVTSLREAVALADFASGLDRISFAASLAGATVALGQDPNADSALFITSDVLITAESAPRLVIRPQSGQNIRVFQVGYGAGLGLKSLSVAGGRAVDGAGGAILSNFGRVYLDSVALFDNSATGSGAAGGAVAVTGGELKIRNSTFSSNRVENASGLGPGVGQGGHIRVLAAEGGFNDTNPDGNSGSDYSIIGSTLDGASSSGVAFVSILTQSVSPGVFIQGSVFSNSNAVDLSFAASPTGQGFAVTGSGNLVESGAAGLPAGFVAATGDPLLGGVLSDNGGNTPTLSPLPGSPLLVQANPVPGLATDQRGVPRAAPFTIGSYQVVRATSLSVVSPGSTRGIGGTIDFKVIFSQPVLVVGQPALALNIPGAKALAINPGAAATSVVFRYTVAPGDQTPGIMAGGPQALDFSGGSILDSAGGFLSGGVPPLPSPGPAVDGVAPSGSIALSPTPASPSRVGAFNGSAFFNEAGLGALEAGDFVLVNATVGLISGPDAAGKYSFMVSPITDGPVSVSLKAGALADPAGNPSLATGSVSFVSDRTPPQPEVSLDPSPGQATRAASLRAVVRFAEAGLSTLSLADIVVGNAAISDFQGPDAAGDYAFTLSPAGDGQVFVSVKGGAVTDQAGNLSKASQTVSFVSDRSGPSFKVASAPVSQSSAGGSVAVSFSLELSDPSGLDPATVTAAAVTLTGPGNAVIPMVLDSYAGGIARFSADLGANPVAGQYKAAYTGSVADSLGNTGKQGGIGGVSVNATDTTQPELLGIARADAANPSFTRSQTFVVTFSEPVTGIGPGSFSLVKDGTLGASISRLSLPDGTPLPGGPVRVVMVEVGSSGRGNLGLVLSVSASLADKAGNPLATPQPGIPSESFQVDTTQVTIVSFGPVSSPRDTGVESIDLVLSKPIADARQVASALTMERNGRRFPLDAEFVVRQTGYSSYRIENFAMQSGVAGSYLLRLNALFLTDPAGQAGAGKSELSWTAVSPITVASFNPVFTPPPTGRPDPFVAGVSKRVLLGMFSDATGGLMSDYIARVNWGDGTGFIPFDSLEVAEILATSTPGVFQVFATHTYALDRNYLINVLIQDTASGSNALLGLVESSSVVVTPLQADQLVREQFIRGDVTNSVLTANLPRPGPGAPVLQVVFTQPPAITGAERTLYLASYATNPQQAPVPAGNAPRLDVSWLDLRASGVDSDNGILRSSFAFVAGTGQEVALYYFNSATDAYEPVLSSGGEVPTIDRDTGLIVVVFDATSTPRLDRLNETVFAVAVAASSSSSTDGSGASAVSTAASVASTVNSTLVQASQTLSSLEKSGQSQLDTGSGSYATSMFVGGRSSTVALTPSALGTGAPARMRASAGGRLALASSRDAAMALGGLLRGAVAPVERRLKPLMEALGITDQDSPQNSPPASPMPDAPRPANPEQPRGGSSSGTGESPPAGIPAPSVRLPERLRVLDEALAVDEEAHAIGPWAMAAAMMLTAVHLRPCRDPRKDEKDQRGSALVSE